MNKSADNYYLNGCGRCELGGTPECKVNSWLKELQLLRKIVLDCGLTEECKWGVPCFTYKNKNVILLAAFKDNCTLSFFKGSLLKNSKDLLEFSGTNSQVSKIIRFTGIDKIEKSRANITSLVKEAIEIERSGKKAEIKKKKDKTPEELTRIFKEDPQLRNAFKLLTPGRQRGYILHFSQPRQAKTRVARIEKCRDQILQGIGLHDKYRNC